MPIVSLRVVEFPDERSEVLRPEGPGPFLEADGEDTWVCGACGRVLCRDMNETVPVEVEGDAPVFMQCPDCAAPNELPTS